jgi:hypothetical protein
MKTFYLFLAILFFAASTLTAQDFSYGVIGGVNFSKIENFGGSGIKENRLGFHFGGVADISFAEKWSYEASLLYSVEGEEWENASGTNTNVKLQYLNIPLQFKYRAYKDFSIHFGPQIGFLLQAEQSIGGADEVKIDNTGNTNFAGTIGFGYDLKAHNLYFKSTFTYGLVDIFKNEASDFLLQHPGTVHFSVGYKFGSPGSKWRQL